MRTLKTLLFLGLALCVLPWGAYSGARVEALKADLRHDATQDAVGSDHADGAGAGAAVVQPARKACRTATLPGAPCSPDHALPATEITALRPPGSTVRRPDPGGAGHGVDLPGLPEPPRHI